MRLTPSLFNGNINGKKKKKKNLHSGFFLNTPTNKQQTHGGKSIIEEEKTIFFTNVKTHNAPQTVVDSCAENLLPV